MSFQEMAALVGLMASGVALAADPPPAATAEKPATAQVAAPSPEAVRSTWDYYYKGKGQGPVLADAKLCLEVGKDGDTKSECTKEVPASGVKSGTMVLLWQAYLIPSGESVEDLSIQVKLGDQVRETKDVTKMSGDGWRNRTWTGIRPNKAGTWTFVLGRGANAIKTFTLTVN